MAQTQVFRGSHRNVVTDGERTMYIYHNTSVVTVYDEGMVMLNSGGWRTRTTKLAMNQVSNQLRIGFKVFQRDFEWFVELPNGKIVDFVDGVTFWRAS